MRLQPERLWPLLEFCWELIERKQLESLNRHVGEHQMGMLDRYGYKEGKRSCSIFNFRHQNEEPSSETIPDVA
jgi:hypothetical protein